MTAPRKNKRENDRFSKNRKTVVFSGNRIASSPKNGYTCVLWKPTTLPFRRWGRSNGRLPAIPYGWIGGGYHSLAGNSSRKEVDTVLLSDIGSIASIVGLILTIVFELRNRKK